MPPPEPNEPKAESFEARLAHSGPLPVVTPPGETGGMLPGVAGTCMYALLMAGINSFAAITGKYSGGGTVKYSVLAFCTLLVVGSFGLLRLKRWGWSLVIGGYLLMGAGNFYGFARTHIPPYVIQGLFALVFFLYLSRTEVRERLR